MGKSHELIIEMKKIMFRLLLTILTISIATISLNAKTLVVYYSYTNHVEQIVNNLRSQIVCDVVEIEPEEKGLDYAANNYEIGSALIAAIRNHPNDPSSYPAIDPVEVNFDDYDTVIIGTPLWWSQMAAPLQTFLFQNGEKMAGKKIGLIVSSHSSGISGVESDAKRLISGGDFLESSLWIRSTQVPECDALISKWLEGIHYHDVNTSTAGITANSSSTEIVYDLNGTKIAERKSSDLWFIPSGIYIVKKDDTKARVVISR